MTIDRFITKAEITMSVKRSEKSRPNWGEGARHFNITLFRRDGLKTSFMFSQGSAHTKDPTLSEVLESLALECSSFENAKNEDDFVSEFCSLDSSENIVHRRAYRAINKQAIRLEKFLGGLYETFLWEMSGESDEPAIKIAPLTIPLSTRKVWAGCYGGHYDIIVFFKEKPTNFDATQKVPFVDILDEKSEDNIAGDMALEDFYSFFPGSKEAIAEYTQKSGFIGRPRHTEIHDVDLFEIELTGPFSEDGTFYSMNFQADWR